MLVAPSPITRVSAQGKNCIAFCDRSADSQVRDLPRQRMRASRNRGAPRSLRLPRGRASHQAFVPRAPRLDYAPPSTCRTKAKARPERKTTLVFLAPVDRRQDDAPSTHTSGPGVVRVNHDAASVSAVSLQLAVVLEDANAGRPSNLPPAVSIAPRIRMRISRRNSLVGGSAVSPGIGAASL